MTEKISGGDFLAVLHECFDRGQELTFTPTGTSMLPMLDGKHDTVTFSPPPDRLKKFDVAFYLRKRTGQLILHRLVGFDKDGGYIFSGDNQYYYEYGVGVDDVLAVVTAFTHDGKTCLPTDFRYRLYIRRMMLKKRIRIFMSKVYRSIFKRK